MSDHTTDQINATISEWMGWTELPTLDYTTDANLVQAMLDRCRELCVDWCAIGASRVGWSVGLNWENWDERSSVWIGPLPMKSEALTSAIVAMVEATSKGDDDGTH